MADEASKTRAHFGALEKRIFRGRGIDIGCGTDPIFPDARPFDIDNGDANRITDFVTEEFDYVFSSHCLEHMQNPYAALAGWWKLVREGGHLYFVVPDEDLYEQARFPSRYNPDHKWTFTANKATSWSNCSINLLELISSLEHARPIKLELQDHGYDYSLQQHDQTTGAAMAQWCVALRRDQNYHSHNYSESPKRFWCAMHGGCNFIIFQLKRTVIGTLRLIRNQLHRLAGRNS